MREISNAELAQRDFLKFSQPWMDYLSKLHIAGFKGYLMDHSGKIIDTVYHDGFKELMDHAKDQIDSIKNKVLKDYKLIGNFEPGMIVYDLIQLRYFKVVKSWSNAKQIEEPIWSKIIEDNL